MAEILGWLGDWYSYLFVENPLGRRFIAFSGRTVILAIIGYLVWTVMPALLYALGGFIILLIALGTMGAGAFKNRDPLGSGLATLAKFCSQTVTTLGSWWLGLGQGQQRRRR